MNLCLRRCIVVCYAISFTQKTIEYHIKRLKNINVTQMIECYANNFKLFSPEIF